ncbi:DUF2585 domain-containing protein [Novosphingobium gossypii]|uniref:DUF2585 domain-containing protein n=1 Tax=Novosphingobium gossypii TaxID=1604774 RepID=UPI003D1BA6DA
MLAIGLGAALLLVELAMGRPPICPCGIVRFWAGDVQSDQNSQQVADWYSFSHVIHGLIFYGLAHLLWRHTPLRRVVSAQCALPLAVAVEGGWELLENSPLIIERYRAVTISYGYSGDSILNSISDVGWMAVGFLAAARIPARVSVALALLFEAVTLFAIRDNLTLNVLMLVHPIDSIREWQGAG